MHSKLTRSYGVALVCLSITLMCAHNSFAQSVSLSLGSGSGQPGTSVSLPLSLTSNSAQTAAIEWTMAYSTADFSNVSVSSGSAAVSAGKTVQCNPVTAGQYKCVIAGSNATVISNGSLATATFTLAAGTMATSTSIQLLGAAGASPTGGGIVGSGLGSTVTVVRPVS